MISMPEDLPDDPVLLKQLLAQLLIERTADKGHIVDLKEQIKLLRDRLFGRKSEQTVEPNAPQLALFNEPESEPMLPSATPTKRSLHRSNALVNANPCRLIFPASKSSTNCPSTN